MWPRGLRKADAAIDLWAKDVAPSTELRQWFAHEVERWPEFVRRYRDELTANRAAVTALVTACRRARAVTLVYAARDEEHNSAVVLRAVLKRRLPGSVRS